MKNWKLIIKKSLLTGYKQMVPPVGVEPTHAASEAAALSTELRGHYLVSLPNGTYFVNTDKRKCLSVLMAFINLSA